jgi:hypothetical protein
MALNKEMLKETYKKVKGGIKNLLNKEVNEDFTERKERKEKKTSVWLC